MAANDASWFSFVKNAFVVLMCNIAFIITVNVALIYESDCGVPFLAILDKRMEMMRISSFINIMSSIMLLLLMVKKWRDLLLWQKIIGIAFICLFMLPSTPLIFTRGERVFMFIIERG